jgi:arsenite methyltransferase
MSSARSEVSDPHMRDWLWSLVGVEPVDEDEEIVVRGRRYVLKGGLLRERAVLSDAQGQTSAAFGFKWRKRDSFESEHVQERARRWLLERYGPVDEPSFWAEHGESPLLVDAGCGAGYSALALFERVLPAVRYLGIDVSEAVDVAATRFAERGLDGAFLQADITALPLEEGSVDVVFSEGVLHHTDSPRDALLALTRLVRPGGRVMFYAGVHRRSDP